MRHILLSLVFLGGPLYAADVPRIESNEASVNGVVLGMSMETVISIFGTPQKIVQGHRMAAYDTEYVYDGVSFFGIKGRLDFIHITGPRTKLPNGVGVGSTMPSRKGVDSKMIEDSDCHLEIYWEGYSVNQIKIYCAL